MKSSLYILLPLLVVIIIVTSIRVFCYNSGHEVVKLISNEIISCLVSRWQAN